MQKQRISTDRFGQPYQVVGIKPNKKNADFNQGYVELGKKLYKLEISTANKDDVDYWVRITQLKKQSNQTM